MIQEQSNGLPDSATEMVSRDAEIAEQKAAKPKVWCVTHQHEHIAMIPRFTYQCKMCGWGQWYGADAKAHEVACPGHETYEVEHVTLPLGSASSSLVATREAIAVIVRDELRKDTEGFGSCDLGLTIADAVMGVVREVGDVKAEQREKDAVIAERFIPFDPSEDKSGHAWAVHRTATDIAAATRGGEKK